MNITDMPCPHGWSKCVDCENLTLCRLGLYKPDKTIVEIAAEIAEKVMHKEAVESAEKIKNPTRAYTDMDRFYSFRVQGLHNVEPWQAKAGPSSPGGGSKSRAPKKPQKKVPEYMKFLGM